jgi:pimeloyl-ACP methyl ester carboxylesterase
MGSGEPTVVFDSGYEDWAPAWSTVQPQVAKWTRACSYDRAGAGFSDPGPMPRTSVRVAEELHTSLHRAGITEPYILVGHAFGSDNVRTFAVLYMDEGAGMVMDDGDFSDFEPKEMQEGDREGRDEFASQLRKCGKAIAEHKPLPPLGSSPDDRGKTCAQQFFRGLPEKEWSPELNAKLLEIAQTKVRDGADDARRNLPAAASALVWLAAHSRAHQRQPRCRPPGGEARGPAEAP